MNQRQLRLFVMLGLGIVPVLPVGGVQPPELMPLEKPPPKSLPAEMRQFESAQQLQALLEFVGGWEPQDGAWVDPMSLEEVMDDESSVIDTDAEQRDRYDEY